MIIEQIIFFHSGVGGCVVLVLGGGLRCLILIALKYSQLIVFCGSSRHYRIPGRSVCISGQENSIIYFVQRDD